MRWRISAWLGRSLGLTDPRQTRAAALRFAVKYSDSTRSYIRRAASNAIARRSLASAIPSKRRLSLTSLSKAAARLMRKDTRESGDVHAVLLLARLPQPFTDLCQRKK